MKKRKVIFYIVLLLTCAPINASAQLGIDAIVDWLLKEVEEKVDGPQEVQDKKLTQVTGELVDRIEVLNKLFFGDEEGRLVGRTPKLIDELTRLVKSVNQYLNYAQYNYNNIRLTYESMEYNLSRDKYSYAYHEAKSIYRDSQNFYDNTVDIVESVISVIQKLITDKTATVQEVRSIIVRETDNIDRLTELARKDAVANLAKLKSLNESVGITASVESMSFSHDDYVKESRKNFGSSLDRNNTSDSRTGVIGTLVMTLISFLCLIYGCYGAIQIIRGQQGAERIIPKIILLYVISFIIIVSIQSFLP